MELWILGVVLSVISCILSCVGVNLQKLTYNHLLQQQAKQQMQNESTKLKKSIEIYNNNDSDSTINKEDNDDDIKSFLINSKSIDEKTERSLLSTSIESLEIQDKGTISQQESRQNIYERDTNSINSLTTTTTNPVVTPTTNPIVTPATNPIVTPTTNPVITPTTNPVMTPTTNPIVIPTTNPIVIPTTNPIVAPTTNPVITPTTNPVITPTTNPVITPTNNPVITPTNLTTNPVITLATNPATTPVVASTDVTITTNNNNSSNTVNTNNDSTKRLTKQRAVIQQPLWLLGMISIIAGAVIDLIAIGYADISLLAPQGSQTLVVNMQISPLFQKEKLMLYDIICTIIILIGTVISLIFGSKSTPAYNIEELTRMFYQPLFISYGVFITIITILSVLYLRYKDRKRIENNILNIQTTKLEMFQYPFLSATSGVHSLQFARLCMQIQTRQIKGSNELSKYTTYIYIILQLFFVLLQLNFQNSGQKRCNALIVVPLYQVCWVLMCIIVSMVYFRDYEKMTSKGILLFVLGVIIIQIGVCYLTKREERLRKYILCEDETCKISIHDSGNNSILLQDINNINQYQISNNDLIDNNIEYYDSKSEYTDKDSIDDVSEKSSQPDEEDIISNTANSSLKNNNNIKDNTNVDNTVERQPTNNSIINYLNRQFIDKIYRRFTTIAKCQNTKQEVNISEKVNKPYTLIGHNISNTNTNNNDNNNNNISSNDIVRIDVETKKKKQSIVVTFANELEKGLQIDQDRDNTIEDASIYDIKPYINKNNRNKRSHHKDYPKSCGDTKLRKNSKSIISKCNAVLARSSQPTRNHIQDMQQKQSFYVSLYQSPLLLTRATSILSVLNNNFHIQDTQKEPSDINTTASISNNSDINKGKRVVSPKHVSKRATFLSFDDSLYDDDDTVRDSNSDNKNECNDNDIKKSSFNDHDGSGANI